MPNEVFLFFREMHRRVKDVMLSGVVLSVWQSLCLVLIGMTIMTAFRHALVALRLPPSISSVLFWGVLLAVPFTNRLVVYPLILFKSGVTTYSILFLSKSPHGPSLNGIANNVVYLFCVIIVSELIFRVIGNLRSLAVHLEENKRVSDTASEAKATFMANMSHEIRTPISGIQGITDMMLSHESLTKSDKNNLQLIKSSADTLVHIVNSILNFSRIEAGKEEIEKKPFHPKPIISQLITSLGFSNKSNDVELQLNFIGVIPDIIVSDAVKIQQIITNLVSNGLKFTHRGSVCVNVSVDSDSMLKVEVDDEGVGIPRDKLDTIFKKFERVSSTYESKIEGTGLGLAITQELINLLRGDIKVESKMGRGTTFTVWIPVDIVDQFDTEAPIYKEFPEIKYDQAHSILLAEDNSVNQLYLKHFLEKQGYNLTIVENGKDAVDHFKLNDYHLVLMDIQMPIMSGVQATEAIRTFEKQHGSEATPILALTASVTEPEQKQFIDAGMNSICPKPIDMKALMSSIKGHICN